jgi:phosphate/sulfate permease
MPAAFVVTGAVIGVGLSLGGTPATAKYTEIAIFWVLIPFVAAGIGFGTATLLRHERVPESVGVPSLAALTGLVIANMRISLIPARSGRDATVADWIARAAALDAPTLAGEPPVAVLVTVALAASFYVAIRRLVRADTEEGVRTFLVILGSFVVFSSGGSQVGLATGPLESLFAEGLGLPVQYLIALGSGAILVGGVLGAPRVVQAVSREYSQLGIRRSVSALVPAFLITQTAITLGLPISMNQTVIASLIGSGLVEGSGGVSSGKIGYTVTFWLVALVGSGAMGAGLFRGLAALFGAP